MKRDPSLHITKSELLDVFDLIFTSKKYKVNTKDLVEEVMRKCRSRTPTHRGILVSNDKLDKKAKQLSTSKRYDADKFSEILYSVRKRNKHRGISLIKPGHKDWGVLKEVTSKAFTFCEDFDLSPRKGFIKYIEIGLKYITKFNIYKFSANHEYICSIYEAIEEIDSDSDPDTTKALYRKYRTKILENTGLVDDTEKYPDKYVWFVRARKQCEELNVAIGLFINAQFEALDFAKGIPHPPQLVGNKAKDRVIRYMYKKGIKIK